MAGGARPELVVQFEGAGQQGAAVLEPHEELAVGVVERGFERGPFGLEPQAHRRGERGDAPQGVEGVVERPARGRRQ